jgi:Ser/Thr protein kinase RdoA (MazF antagonist)
VTNTEPTPAEVFRVAGKARETQRYGSGHIHDTFVVSRDVGGIPVRYLLQRLNTRVFADPSSLSLNIGRITAHLHRKYSDRGATDADRRSLRVVPTKDGAAIHVAASGECWRMFHFIEATGSRDTLTGPDQAVEAGRAFGAFAADLADLSGPPLTPTIPDFHDLALRVAQLQAAAEADAHDRATAVRSEIARAADRFRAVRDLLATVGAATLPERIVHNDCKLNNLLFDETTDEAICVIDLDTVMSGSVLYDFGELVRTGSCRAPEDETNLDRIAIDLELFDALARGYLAGAAALLTETEIRALPLAGPTMALENSVRFLTDHLAGDSYFKIHRPGHNLDRARAQMQLVEQMLAAQESLQQIVEGARRRR